MAVSKAVQRTGYADFWELRARNAIPKETTNYVPIILAMTIMHKNAKDYGLEDLTIDEPLAYDTVETPGSYACCARRRHHRPARIRHSRVESFPAQQRRAGRICASRSGRLEGCLDQRVFRQSLRNAGPRGACTG